MMALHRRFASIAAEASVGVVTSMTVNGEAVRFRLDPATPLLWALRDAANLTGAKYGCDDAGCGACTVIADGRAVRSCAVTLAAMEGADIVTIEALSNGRAHPVQQAWAAEGVSQCGFCEPGMIMAIAALLRASASPSEAEVDALANLCRCGTQPRVRRAIRRAAIAMAAMAAPPPTSPRPQAAGDEPVAAEPKPAGE